MRVVVFYDYFSPAYQAGGPIRSLVNLVSSLNSVEFCIVTGNQDLDGSSLEVAANEWISYSENTQVIYLDRSKRTKAFIEKVLSSIEYDLIYINGVFSLFTTWIPLAIAKKKGEKVLLAPRGMFQRGALAIKPLKKRIYLAALKYLFLKRNNNIFWHATDPQEMQDIKSVISRSCHIIEAGNVPSFIRQHKINKKDLAQPLRFVTISLISRKKNHIFFLNLLSSLKLDCSIIYDIYGPEADPSYHKELKRQAAILPENIQVNFHSAIRPSEINQVLERYHFFVLPTLGENFGHAIFEAFNVGLPVLISDQTPWKDVNSKNGGWSLPLEVKSWGKAVQDIVEMTSAEYINLKIGARQIAEGYMKDSHLVNRYEAMFGEVIHEKY